MTWVLQLTIHKNSLSCRFHHFLSIPCTLFWWKSLLFHHLQKVSTFVTGATVAFRADYDGDTLLSADVGGTGSRSGLSGWQRICQKIPSWELRFIFPYQRQFLKMILHFPRWVIYVSSLQGTCTSMVFIDCWLPLLDSTWRCCILWFLDLKGKCIRTSEL